MITWSNATGIRDKDDAAVTDKPAIKEHARDNDGCKVSGTTMMLPRLTSQPSRSTPGTMKVVR